MLKTEANEKSIEAIDQKLTIVGGDMLKIEYLENSLKRDLPMEVRKHVHIQLSDLYSKRLMYGEAAKKLEGAAELSQKFKEKKELYMRQVALLIKNLSFDDADKVLKRALTNSTTSAEKNEIKMTYKNIFLEKAASLEKMQNFKKASEIYEKILAMEPSTEIRRKLVFLYNRVGKIKEAIAMENTLKNPQPVQPVKKVVEDFNIDEFLNN